MYTTTHYGLNIVEGTDVVNPLVQQNPNYTAIDSAMYANKQAVIGTGTELTAGTVHTITRLNQDSNYVRFTATSNWTAGDSMVIDSTPVSVYLSDGTTPETGAYVINTEVLILVNGSRVTLLTSKKEKDEQTAAQVSYDNASSGLSATNVQDAIDEVNSDKVPKSHLSSRTLVVESNLTTPASYTIQTDGWYFAELQSSTSNAADISITANSGRISHQYSNYAFCACNVFCYFKAGTVIGFTNGGNYSSVYRIVKFA